MWNLDDVPVYLAIVDKRGISRAALALGVSKSMVSKALGRLEEALGVRLLERNSRNIHVTTEGATFYRHAVLIMEQVNETQAIMAGLTSVPCGRLSVALPIAFSREIVSPHLERFHQQYPLVELDILITSHMVDIIREQIDMAVVVGPLHSSELVVTKLYRGGLVWVAGAMYVEQNLLGESLTDLRSHIRICEKRYGFTHFPVRVGEQKLYIDLSTGLMHVNDPIAVREAVLHGCGVSLLPWQYAKRHLENGQLVNVFQQVEFEAESAELSAIYPSRRLLSNRTRAFLDFLKQICAEL